MAERSWKKWERSFDLVIIELLRMDHRRSLLRTVGTKARFGAQLEKEKNQGWVASFFSLTSLKNRRHLSLQAEERKILEEWETLRSRGGERKLVEVEREHILCVWGKDVRLGEDAEPCAQLSPSLLVLLPSWALVNSSGHLYCWTELWNCQVRNCAEWVLYRLPLSNCW